MSDRGSPRGSSLFAKAERHRRARVSVSLFERWRRRIVLPPKVLVSYLVTENRLLGLVLTCESY
jgi:hypothetical protein